MTGGCRPTGLTGGYRLTAGLTGGCWLTGGCGMCWPRWSHQERLTASGR
jgi:hypothetical protein